MSEQTEATFKCLRCGHTYAAPYSPDAPLQERTCPHCRSNSVRRIKDEKRAD